MPATLLATPPVRPMRPPVLPWIALGLLLLSALALLGSPDVDGLRRLIRWTARSSLLLFLLAYVAGPATRRWPGAATAWLLARRRSWGLGLALSHSVHLLAIAGFAQLDGPAFRASNTAFGFASSALGVLCLAAMTLSANDRAVAWLGARRWSWLHRVGLHYLWLGFMVGFAKRLPLSAGYALPVALLLVALLLRVWPVSRRVD